MTREEAKKLAQSRDCKCIKGKDRDNNYEECIDRVFDYFEEKLERMNNQLIVEKLITTMYSLKESNLLDLFIYNNKDLINKLKNLVDKK